MGSKRTINSVETAITILTHLRDEDGGRVTEISADLDLPSSTVHSHLATLEQNGLAVKEGDFYYVGSEFLRFGTYVQRRKRPYELAERHVTELVEETGCRAVFVVEEHGYGVFLHTKSGEYTSWRHATAGEREHLHTTAAGKAILAQLPEPSRKAILERHGLPQKTRHTIADPAVLDRQLGEIRERGYAFNREENIEGVRAVGAPAMGPHGQVIGGFSVSGPAKRLTGERFEAELPRQLLGVVNEFELELSLS